VGAAGEKPAATRFMTLNLPLKLILQGLFLTNVLHFFFKESINSSVDFFAKSASLIGPIQIDLIESILNIL